VTVHDDDFLDSIAVLALGALPAAEAHELASHVATCDSCRRAYDEYRRAADLVGYSAEIQAGELDQISAARMKSAVMRVVRESAEPAGRISTNGATSVSAPGRRSYAWFAYAAAAAAIVVALLTNANNASLRSEHERDIARIATSDARADARAAQASALAARVAALEAPGSKHFAVPGGAVVTSGGHVYFAMRLPAPPAGKVYQAWTVARGGKAVAPSLTFVPDAGGVAVVELPENAAALKAVALTVEPTGGSKTPTSKPAFVRPLS
jgi:hypothetical protein